MNEQKKKAPDLRFKGFTDVWEQRKLKTVVLVNSGKDYKSLEKGNIPVYGTGGYITSVSKFLSNQDAIGLGRKGTINKPYILKAPFWTVDTLFYLTLKPENILTFIYSLIQKINWLKYDESTGLPSLSKKNIENILVYLTKLDEQQKIGKLIVKLDKFITLQQRKLELLKQLKKGLLQKMFADKDSKRPILRFSGFTEDWKQCKLGKLARIDTGKLNANAMVMDGKYDFYTSGKEKYKIDKYAFVGPAITVAGNGATVGYMHYADNKFNAYQRTYVLTNLKGDRRFLFNTIQANLPHKIYQESRTGNIPYIVLDMLTDLSIMIPLKEEQASIGNFVNVMDNFITAQENRLNSSKLTKKFLLQKLFI